MANENVGPSRPTDLSDDQVKNLAIGLSYEVGEHSRPRALTDKDIKTLSAGKELDLENIPMLGRLAASEAGVASAGAVSKPRDLTDKEVEALRAGKEGYKE